MDQPKNNKCSIILAILITAIVVGFGVYFWQNREHERFDDRDLGQLKQPQKELTESNTPPVAQASKDQNEPISFSTTGIPVQVSKTTKTFDLTAEQLSSMAEECGSTHAPGYFDSLVETFKGKTVTQYLFKYLGETQESDTYIVTLIPNAKGYKTLDDFKKDFDQCFAGGDAYPEMLNSNWLLFSNACGTGYSDGSGRPIGCEEISKVVRPSLKFN